MLSPSFNSIPPELCALPRWVTWKGTKVPFCASSVNSFASATDPETWASFPMAQTAYEEGGYLGVGFVLNGDGIVGVDLDKCVLNGQPVPPAMALMERIGCQYVELSPSGNGLRGFGYGSNLKGKRGILDGLNLELYSSARYLTVTGHALKAGPLVELPGFAEAANELSHRSPTEDTQKSTEEYSSHLPFSSVGIPAHTLPLSEGERNRCLFELTRYVKGKRPDAGRSELRAIAQEWHQLALPVIGTKDFGVTFSDFLRGWNNVKQPHGQTLNVIMSGIDFSSPLPANIEALGYGTAGKRLYRICCALQSHAGKDPFFISARQAGELAGVHYTDAAKLLNLMTGDDVLELVSKGSGRVASRYRMK